MKRIISSILALLTVFASAAMILPQTVAAESLYVRKIVSVVYDDSSSMYDPVTVNGEFVPQKKWAYASYAMQAFCGMLNSEDQLYITYMSDIRDGVKPADPAPVDLKDGIDESVSDIKDRSERDGRGTPYYAVESAMDDLRNATDADENTQYWLVVITDGQFYNNIAGVPQIKDENGNAAESPVTKTELNRLFGNFVDETMPNGTRPQVTYFAISGDDVPENATAAELDRLLPAPDANEDRGIRVMRSSSGEEIIEVMRSIANQVSGRSELTEFERIDEKTVRVKSEVPLLNIAVLAQKTDAEVESATANTAEGKAKLSIAREVEFEYPEHYARVTDETLVGSGFLINNGGDVIGAGEYDLVFDGAVGEDDFVIMFEPAIEVRPVITLNGEEIDDPSLLGDTVAGDKVSIAYKIYQTGTDKEIDFNDLPGTNECKILITEDGAEKKSAKGADAHIDDYALNYSETGISITVQIEGLNPITWKSQSFTPLEHAPVVYTLTADYGSSLRSVNIREIAENKDLNLVFTVLADGVPMTDPTAVQALIPKIDVAPTGNSGTTAVSTDGKIVFTPTSGTASSDPSYNVTVTCTVADATASIDYTVLISEFKVVPDENVNEVVKTEFFGNDKGVAFYITRDGVKLNKEEAEAEGAYSATLSDPSYLSMRTEVLADGTILCTPFAEKDYEITFGTWWIYWHHYLFTLPSGDLTVTLSHSLGTAENILEVADAPLSFVIVNVVLPLAIEIALIAFIIYWIAVVAFLKPRFRADAVIYYGTITRVTGSHAVSKLKKKHLSEYNKLSCRLWPPTPKAEKVKIASGIEVYPGPGSQLICVQKSDWYTGNAKIINGGGVTLMFNDEGSTPEDINTNATNMLVNIQEITYVPDQTGNLISFENKFNNNGKKDRLRNLKKSVVSVTHQIAGTNDKLYYIIPSKEGGTSVEGGITHIERGTIFCYTTAKKTTQISSKKSGKKKKK